MEMGDHDLQLFGGRRNHFPADETFLPHRNYMAHPYHEEAFSTSTSTVPVLSNGMGIPSGLVTFGLGHQYDHNFNIGASVGASISATLFGVEMESGGWSLRNMDGAGGGNSRWPRQETLTLLDIRSKLDSKFKEANHKGPLWDEVSRIMAEEHGYRRSGKKCREKFENLYKYYKKTREGKAGRRQDGKNYRFFRQLEALYGTETTNQSASASASVSETNNHLPQRPDLLFQTPNNINIHQENKEQKTSDHQSLSFFNLSEFETSSSENNDVDDDDLSAIAFNQKNGSSWKTKVIKELVELQMKKLIDAQDVWMERMLKTIEDREKERLTKEEEWRRREMVRLDKEHQLWVKERGWVKVRDAALMEVLNKFTAGNNNNNKGVVENQVQQLDEINRNTNRSSWSEHEISSLIKIRKSLDRNSLGNPTYGN